MPERMRIDLTLNAQRPTFNCERCLAGACYQEIRCKLSPASPSAALDHACAGSAGASDRLHEARRISWRISFRNRCLVRAESRNVRGGADWANGANDCPKLCFPGRRPVDIVWRWV